MLRRNLWVRTKWRLRHSTAFSIQRKWLKSHTINHEKNCKLCTTWLLPFIFLSNYYSLLYVVSRFCHFCSFNPSQMSDYNSLSATKLQSYSLNQMTCSKWYEPIHYENCALVSKLREWMFHCAEVQYVFQSYCSLFY